LDEVEFTVERNCFAEVKESVEDPEDILKNNNYTYIKHDGKYYVLGMDVYKIAEIEGLFKRTGAQTSYFSSIRRPMQDGILNTAHDSMSLVIIKELIKRALGGEAKKPNTEVCCFCVPGDNSTNNVIYHRTMLTNIIKQLGYIPEPINESFAIILAENPCADDPDEPNGVSEHTGLSFSFGGGLVNACLARRQLPLLTFSIENSGDFVDKEAVKIAGGSVEMMTRYKERIFNLNKVDDSNLKDSALSCMYDCILSNVLEKFSAKFEKIPKDERITTPFEIVVAGGTSMVPGFIERFRQVIADMERRNLLPFIVKNVRLAENPLLTVSTGCLAKATSVQNKIRS